MYNTVNTLSRHLTDKGMDNFTRGSPAVTDCYSGMDRRGPVTRMLRAEW